MIYYFSATGNSKYAAEKIAVRTDDKAADIVNVIKKSKLKVCSFLFV